MRQVQVPADNFLKLKTTVKWYDDMPAFLEVGDRFHEKMDDIIGELVPSIPELETDDWYRGGLELVDDKLLLTIIPSYADPEDSGEFQVELISE